ncbi:hypothetical protein BC826DRAFT_978988 [Russula brevipes]|nr:hypothetical protein BC826DRAFT_978988 [Russula brevipes]
MAEDPRAQAHSTPTSPRRSKVTSRCLVQKQIVTRPRMLLVFGSPHALIVVPSSAAWAKDEPPSPTDSHHEPPSPGGSRDPSDAPRADDTSHPSSIVPSEHRCAAHPPLVRIERRPSIFRSASITAGFARREDPHSPALGGGKGQEQAGPSRLRDRSLRISMPGTPAATHTLSHSRTPGWDSPWAPRPLESLSHRTIYEQLQNGDSAEEQPPEGTAGDGTWWPRTRKRARAYLLHNTYVPLLFRFINITFTTAALAVALRIRREERYTNSEGVLGSSPTLVVIFAPLTLVHVMVSVYLEYFGRPLGLWRTSAKLAHTLLEVLLICAWSAALSLCFDNFFSSPIPCASASKISCPFGDNRGQAGESLCDHQLALIVLVGIGLIVYCFNLVLSLYRIFEKVKYHHASAWNGSSARG